MIKSKKYNKFIPKNWVEYHRYRFKIEQPTKNKTKYRSYE